MIFIKKASAPLELERLKKKAEEEGLSDTEAYSMLKNPLKNQVREALMQEQGHLCAYCMRRIPDERIPKEDENFKDIYIEHWQARSAKCDSLENKGLDYNNMLAVCSGNEVVTRTSGKHKRRFLTCDKKRGNQVLKVNPLDEDTLKTIYYESDGTIKSTDKVINNDLDIKLNLNCSLEAVTLPENRKAVLDTIQMEIIQGIGPDGEGYLDKLKEQLSIWQGETDPKTPYIGMALWWLKKEIKDFR